MSTPENYRLSALAQNERDATAKAYRPEPAEDTRDHHTEVMAAHQGAPSAAVQDRTHGAGRPAEDRGRPA